MFLVGGSGVNGSFRDCVRQLASSPLSLLTEFCYSISLLPSPFSSSLHYLPQSSAFPLFHNKNKKKEAKNISQRCHFATLRADKVTLGLRCFRLITSQTIYSQRSLQNRQLNGTE